MILLAGLLSPCMGDNTCWFDELDITYMEIESGQNLKNKISDTEPLTISGKEYAREVATIPVSKFLINLHGKAERFIAEVCIDDANRNGSEAEFIVLRDKKIIWRICFKLL